jgi:hypothetical protein
MFAAGPTPLPPHFWMCFRTISWVPKTIYYLLPKTLRSLPLLYFLGLFSKAIMIPMHKSLSWSCLSIEGLSLKICFSEGSLSFHSWKENSFKISLKSSQREDGHTECGYLPVSSSMNDSELKHRHPCSKSIILVIPKIHIISYFSKISLSINSTKQKRCDSWLYIIILASANKKINCYKLKFKEGIFSDK